MKQILLITSLIFSATYSSSGQDKEFFSKGGIYTGINYGTWFPTGRKNKILGNPTIIGFTLDFKYKKRAWGGSLDLIGFPKKGMTLSPITIKVKDTVVMRNDYGGFQATIDYSREFAESRRFVFEGTCSIGYGELFYYDQDSTTISKASLIVSPGINIRYIISNTYFAQLKIQYCMADYALKDEISTDLRGHYMTAKIIIGSY